MVVTLKKEPMRIQWQSKIDIDIKSEWLIYHINILIIGSHPYQLLTESFWNDLKWIYPVAFTHCSLSSSLFLFLQCQSIPSQDRVLILLNLPPFPLPTHSIHAHVQSSAMPRGADQPAARSDKPCLFTSDPWGCALWALTFDLPCFDLGSRGHLFSSQPGDALLPSQVSQPPAALIGNLWREGKGSRCHLLNTQEHCLLNKARKRLCCYI